MARAFEDVIRLQLAKYSPEEAKRRHIAIARQGLADFLARQEVPPAVAIETDFRPATSEDSVRPFGVITYRFTRIREIAAFALAEAARLSPRASGRYAESWFVMVDDREAALDDIPNGATVVVVNDQPYSRKINVGARGFERYAPPGVAEKVKELVKRRYGALVTARVDFVTLAGGWKLRQSAKSSGRRVRPDRRKGADVTYPAIVIAPKFR